MGLVQCPHTPCEAVAEEEEAADLTSNLIVVPVPRRRACRCPHSKPSSPSLFPDPCHRSSSSPAPSHLGAVLDPSTALDSLSRCHRHPMPSSSFSSSPPPYPLGRDEGRGARGGGKDAGGGGRVALRKRERGRRKWCWRGRGRWRRAET